MSPETHSQLANFIWNASNLFRKVILPLAILRRFDCLFAPQESSSRIAIVFNGSPLSIIEARS